MPSITVSINAGCSVNYGSKLVQNFTAKQNFMDIPKNYLKDSRGW